MKCKSQLLTALIVLLTTILVLPQQAYATPTPVPTVAPDVYTCEYLYVRKSWSEAPSNNQDCYASDSSCVLSGTFRRSLDVGARILKNGTIYTGSAIFSLSGPMNWGNDEQVSYFSTRGEHYYGGTAFSGFSPDRPGTYTITIKIQGPGTNNPIACKGNFVQSDTCNQCETTMKDIAINYGGVRHYEYRICDQINTNLTTPEGANAKQRCIECVGGDELGREGIWTAVGCIPRDPETIVKSMLRLGLGMGGGFSLIIILASGFVLSVSQGEAKRIDEAKQWLTSALVGMLFIIFSVTLLHFIGYTIFRIPGFGE